LKVEVIVIPGYLAMNVESLMSLWENMTFYVPLGSGRYATGRGLDYPIEQAKVPQGCGYNGTLSFAIGFGTFGKRKYSQSTDLWHPRASRTKPCGLPQFHIPAIGTPFHLCLI